MVRGKSHFSEHPEKVWRWLELWDKFGPGLTVRSGLGAAPTSGVDGTDWRRWGDSQMRVSAQRGDNSDSRIEIQQDGTMAVVDPELAVELTEPSVKGVEMLSVDT
ncbi:hypothetical protein NDU88_001393 [Pleurodeles waltl]|uniref:Uncharacterized protein n=1 Tax=Pleurodeles waltl TaxID=8319 RepID=A0AAV7U8D1_PLEWA|nr:hypothetical protein NDU88_001393 [Pleurodeles waltl]